MQNKPFFSFRESQRLGRGGGIKPVGAKFQLLPIFFKAPPSIKYECLATQFLLQLIEKKGRHY